LCIIKKTLGIITMKIKKRVTLPILLVSLFSCITSVNATSGRTNSEGCHTSKGNYHCHNSGKSTSSTIKKETNNTRVMAKDGQYKRAEWRHWIDSDKDCQDTRAEALIIASKGPVKFKTSKQCEVIEGNFYDPYTNAYYKLDNDLDIDHIVPLKDAHVSGGYNFSKETKKQFANDPINIIAVNLSQNRSKGDKHPLIWMPENKAYHCQYVTQWIDIKKKYNLHIRTGVIRMKEKLCQ